MLDEKHFYDTLSVNKEVTVPEDQLKNSAGIYKLKLNLKLL